MRLSRRSAYTDVMRIVTDVTAKVMAPSLRSPARSVPNTSSTTRNTVKTPTLTMATACSSALTGTGATMAAGSQAWTGSSAAFAMPNRNST